MKILIAISILFMLTVAPAHAGKIHTACRILGAPLWVAGWTTAMTWDVVRHPVRGWRYYNRHAFIRL